MAKTASHFGTVTASVAERKATPRKPKSAPIAVEVSIAVTELEQLADEYLLDCEYRQHRPHTIVNNRGFLRKFAEFLKQNGYAHCGKQEIRLFLHHLQQPVSSGGRGVRPITARTYHRCLATFFKWTVEEGAISVSPMEKIKAPMGQEHAQRAVVG